jgi:hypothetical protein
MLFLLSPAKTLDYETPVGAVVRRRQTDPLFIDQAAELVAELQRKTPAQVASLMDLSDALAQLNVGRYGLWQRQATDRNSKPAVLAFDGDVYDGLQARTMSAADLDWAQRHLVILSGLYGVLRPLDRLQPYRLEMGTALPTRRGRDLYAYWGDHIAQHLNERLADESSRVVVNLASVEYSRAALRPALQARVIDCVFEDWKDGGYKIISFFAKRARGAMARWAVDHRLRSPARLKDFSADGYGFAADASSADRWVFRRRAA